MLPAHVTIVCLLSARGNIAGKLPAPETYSQTVSNGDVLKLVPQRNLYTQQSGEHGELEPLPKERILRYYFKVEIQASGVFLTQVPDEFGKKDFFDIEGQPFGAKHEFHLEPERSLTILFNVPGGGPAWTVTLQRPH